MALVQDQFTWGRLGIGSKLVQTNLCLGLNHLVLCSELFNLG